MDPTGSILLSWMTDAPVNPQAMVLGPDGSLYVAGTLFLTGDGLHSTRFVHAPTGIPPSAKSG